MNDILKRLREVKEYYTYESLARELGVSTLSVIRWIKRGETPSVVYQALIRARLPNLESD